mmetsp:Transcript_37775/g.93787  ORF Transcript_37775/g.93787 Transcript_37775/m.93787 type:complete len:337 (-) Transcript_37775:42-1052(-)
MWCASALASLLLLFGSMLDGSRTEGAAPVLHPGRRVLSAQPEPIHRPAKHPSQCWEVVARVERQLTGKASGWTSEARLLMAATKDAVLERRAEFFDEYVHTPQVALEPKRKTAVVSAPAAQRARRNSAPTTFSFNEGRRGPPPGGERAGPGRGHTFEHTPRAPVEQTVPWVVGKVVVGAHVTETVSPDFNEGQDTIRFEAVRAGDSALRVRLWEALEPGSSTFTLSDIEVLVAARRVRVPDVELVEARQGSRRAEHSTRRFVISPDSLQQIRAEMPTSDDEWEVEKVLQYRTYYRQEQWLIKWKDYGEDRNTWEPLAHLSDDVQVDAQRVKELCIA